MIPETIGTVTAFLLLIVPGMIFELLRQRRRPSVGQTPLEEITRIVVSSLAFGSSSVLILALVGQFRRSWFISTSSLAAQGASSYWRTHWAAILATLAVETLIAVVLVVLTHRSLNKVGQRGLANRAVAVFDRLVGHIPGGQIERAPVWNEMFRNRRPDGSATQLTILKKDGSLVMGRLAAYTVTDEVDENRDIALEHPISVLRCGSKTIEQLDQKWLLLLIPAWEISEIYVTYPEELTMVK